MSPPLTSFEFLLSLQVLLENQPSQVQSGSQNEKTNEEDLNPASPDPCVVGSQ